MLCTFTVSLQIILYVHIFPLLLHVDFTTPSSRSFLPRDSCLRPQKVPWKVIITNLPRGANNSASPNSRVGPAGGGRDGGEGVRGGCERGSGVRGDEEEC